MEQTIPRAVHILPPISIRARTGLIFFIGLFLLVFSTVVVTTIVSRAIGQDEEVIAVLGQLDAQVDRWTETALARPDAPALRPAMDFEQTVRLLLHGGQLPRGGRAPLALSPASDERFVQSLERASSAWAEFHVAAGTLTGQPGNVAARQRVQDLSLELRDALDQAARAIQVHRAANTGMVRGMYAALFPSTLIFLLVGLWFTEQTIVAPVEALNQIAHRIAAGDLDTPVALGGKGEFLALARSFETMRLELRQSHEQLTRWASDLEARVTQRTQQFSALSQVVATASRSLELDEVLRTALEQSLQVIGVEMGGLWLVDETSGDLHLAASHGMSDTMREQVSVLKAGEGATGRAARSGQTIVLEDISQMPQAVKGIAIEEGLRSLVAAPIKIRDRVVGVLDVTTCQPRPFTTEEIVLLTSIGQQIGIAVDSLRLMQETHQQARRVASLQERERIGAELHDGLLQTLGYLYLQIDQLSTLAASSGSDEVAFQLARLCGVLEGASRDVRQFIGDLREPPPPAPLQIALREMVTTFDQESAMQVTLETDGQPLLLGADQSTHLVQIAREALVNAAKHGRAGRARLVCSSRGACGELRVEDDGVGFIPAQVPRDGREHFGLSIMQARAARIGGRLSVDSAPGHGTRVCVTWPLEGDP